MAEYTELIKTLRHCATRSNGCVTCAGCPMSSENGDVIECINALHKDAAAAIEALKAKVADYEDTLKWHRKEFAELRAMIDDANARLEVGKARNQYTLIEPKNKRYTLRCPKCGTVVGLMEVQE